MRPEATMRRRDPKYDKLYAAASFYRGAAAFLLLVVIIQAGAIIWLATKSRFARAIRVDGNVVCFVRNEKAAEEVRERLLQAHKGDLPGAAIMEQKWEDLNWPLEHNDKVFTVNKAIETLRSKVTVKVAAAAITQGDHELVVLATKDLAQIALTSLKKEYSGGSGTLQEASFLEEDVRIADTKAQPKSIVTDVHAAIEILKTPREGVGRYVVVAGDSWRKIADDYSTTITQLRKLNPRIGDVIHVGDKITVSVPNKPLTVVTIMQETREVPYELKREEVKTDTLPKGETRVTIKGVPGTKLVTEKVTYHNSKEQSRKQIDETVTKPAVAERVMIGTATTTDS